MSNRYCMLSSYCSHQTENYNTTAINTGNSLWPFIFFSLQAVDIKTSLFRMGRQLWWISAETGVTAIIWKARWDCYYLNCHHITPICTEIFCFTFLSSQCCSIVFFVGGVWIRQLLDVYGCTDSMRVTWSSTENYSILHHEIWQNISVSFIKNYLMHSKDHVPYIYFHANV